MTPSLNKVNKNVILVIALVVVAVAGYFIFKGGSSDEPAVSTVSGITDSAVGQELVIELNRLKSLRNVDDKFLTEDPVFNSLFDFTQPVPEQPLGRENPFAAVGTSF